jgi:hypothetical protein
MLFVFWLWCKICNLEIFHHHHIRNLSSLSWIGSSVISMCLVLLTHFVYDVFCFLKLRGGSTECKCFWLVVFKYLYAPPCLLDSCMGIATALKVTVHQDFEGIQSLILLSLLVCFFLMKLTTLSVFWMLLRCQEGIVTLCLHTVCHH